MQLNINVNTKTNQSESSQGTALTNFEWHGDDRGTFGFINLRPGLDLVVGRGVPNRHPKIEFDFGTMPLELAFHIRGVRKHHIVFSHADKREGIVQAGQFAVTHLSFCHGEIQSIGDQAHLCLAIYITADFLRTYCDEDHWTGLPGPILSLVRSDEERTSPIIEIASTDLDMAVVVQKIMNCPYNGTLGRMYLEGKALELMAMAFNGGGHRSGSKGSLSKRERERIRAAHYYLLKDLGDPPDLGTLSRIAGMNRNKLNRGFRELYGDSAFGILRRAKLDQALWLLAQGNLNVGQVAHAAGFKSHSHLTRAFVKQFGMQPRAYRKCPTNKFNHTRQPLSDRLDPDEWHDDSEGYNLLRLMQENRI